MQSVPAVKFISTTCVDEIYSIRPFDYAPFDYAQGKQGEQIQGPPFDPSTPLRASRASKLRDHPSTTLRDQVGEPVEPPTPHESGEQRTNGSPTPPKTSGHPVSGLAFTPIRRLG